MLKNFRSDYKRYKKEVGFVLHEPSIIIVFLYRIRRSINSVGFLPVRILLKIFTEPFYLFLTPFFGIHLPKKCEIGPGLMIYHFGGIILNSYTKMGSNCTIRHNVTIGNRHEIDDVPVIGDDVNIGAGAVLIGRIKIGNHVDVGANAVVLTDVPDDHIAVGNPARIIKKKD
jgi:serine O-acetyltransferase